MATRAQFHWLFHLPAALRCRMIIERHAHEARPFKRAFGGTTRAFARQSKPPPPPPPPRPSRPSPERKAPKLSAPPPRPQLLDADMGNLLHASGQLLLYKAPNHTSFFFSSYLFGSVIIGSSVIHASFTADDKALPWYSRLLTSGLAFFLAIVGTAFILAPTKMIRSVSLARNQVTDALFLRFQTKSVFPFASRFRGDNAINAPLHQVYIDRAINSNSLPPYINVPWEDAEAFTQFQADAADGPKPSIVQRVREFNRSLLNIWPNLWWDVRRMFLRDGMVYVKIPGHGQWKLDLRNAELLDNGRPLTATMIPSALDRSVVGWLRAATGR